MASKKRRKKGCPGQGMHAVPEGGLDGLPDYQGGAGRHVCPECAYMAGLAEGREQMKRELLAAIENHPS